MRTLDLKDLDFVMLWMRTHRAMQRLYGSDFDKEAAPFVATIRARMAEHKEPMLKATYEIISDQKVKEVAATLAMYLAAAMVICETDKTP